MIAEVAAMLSRYGKLHLVKRIIKSFTRYSDEQFKRSKATVAVAHTLGAKEEEELKQQISKTLGAEHVTVTVDESLLGGATITKGFTIIDASAKGQLERMQQITNI